MNSKTANRPLTALELELARWMLAHGNAEAEAFLPQLELAEVTPWKCPCGCASINFQILGHEEALPGVNILGDFVLGDGDSTGGAFIFASGGILSGIEVYSFGDPVTILPNLSDLREF
jgi:hypothetical protein